MLVLVLWSFATSIGKYEAELNQCYTSHHWSGESFALTSRYLAAIPAASLNPVKTGNPYTPQLIDNREDNAEEGFRFLLGSDPTVGEALI